MQPILCPGPDIFNSQRCNGLFNMSLVLCSDKLYFKKIMNSTQMRLKEQECYLQRYNLLKLKEQECYNILQ